LTQAILFIAPQIPFPLDTGGKIRAFYQLRALSQRYRVHLVALGPRLTRAHASDPLWSAVHGRLASLTCVSRDGATRIGTFCAGVRSFLGPLPWPVEKYRSRAAERTIAKLCGETRPVAVHFDSLHTFRFVDSVPGGIPVVLDQHNVEALILERMATVSGKGPRRWLIDGQARQTDRFERRATRRADRILLCSHEDRALLAQRAGRLRGLEVIPNGVDLARFDATKLDQDELAEMRASPNAVFLGSMDWWPNDDGIRWFIDEIWELARRQVPELTLRVVGRNPGPELLALDGTRGIEVLGGVPDVRPFMAAASVFVVPLRVGGGTRLKILEALGIRAPIVSTSIGCEGIELTPGADLLVADDPRAFADAMRRVVQDPALSGALRESGYQRVEAGYSWDAIGRRVVDVYEEVVP
jgi:polysaccharide biosynthesis protein PslH